MKRYLFAFVLLALGISILIFWESLFSIFSTLPFLRWFLGIGSILGGLAMLKQARLAAEQDIPPSIQEKITYLVENGHRILVDLSHCQVHEHSQKTEVDSVQKQWEWIMAPSSALAAAKIIAKGAEPTHLVVDMSFLSLKIVLEGEERTFISGALPFNAVSVQIKCAAQKQTILYVDRKNPEEYWFDLRFLFRS